MSSRDKTSLTYRAAGVDIERGEELVKRISGAAARTHRAGVMGGLGGFGGLFDLAASGYSDPILVSSTDGVGTKLLVALETGRHDTIGIDLVAMCVNDVLVQGAEPLFFLDYFATGKLSVDVAEAVIKGVARGCAEAGAALLGGETAEMPGMYADGHYDLAGFTVGVVDRGRLIDGSTIEQGDVILGLASSGVHSNGYSLVRRIVATAGATYKDKFADTTLGEALLMPTRIYVNAVLTCLKQHPMKALAHITGGGLTENLPRVVPTGVGAEINLDSWPLPDIFTWLLVAGRLDPAEMLRTFNCGIGMAIVANANDADMLAESLSAAGETVYVIGRIVKGRGDVSFVGELGAG